MRVIPSGTHSSIRDAADWWNSCRLTASVRPALVQPHPKALIEQRVVSLQRARNLQLGLAAAGLLIAAYFFYSFYLVTRGGMREVTRHIDAMAKGDLSASPKSWGGDEAAELMLIAILDSGREVGFKAAGGVRTTQDALQYLQLAARIMGDNWLTPAHMRFGASGLLAQLLETVRGKT